MLTLDVACGSEPHGNVNIDLYEDKGIHRNTTLNPKQIPNFILADGHYLPFKSNTFDYVECHHLLEHRGVEHNQICKELIRVARHKITITVPGVLRANVAENKAHDKIFTPSTFHAIFKQFKHTVTMQNPDGWLRLRMPIKELGYLVGHIGKQIPCPIKTIIKCEVWK